MSLSTKLPYESPPPIKGLASSIDWSATNVSLFFYDNIFLYKQTRKKDEEGQIKIVNEKICRRIQVLALKRDIDTGEMLATLAFWFRDRDVTVDVPLLQLSNKEIPNLLQYGFSVGKKNETTVASFLAEQIQIAPMFNFHSKLGFRRLNGVPVYLHHSGVGVCSTYNGELPIQPTGTYEAWYTLMVTEIIPHVPAVVPLVIGFTALILGFLSLYREVQSIFAHFWGRHGTGKTTAELISLSIFGRASSKSGLLLPWLSTSNSLVGVLGNCYGVCFAFDESSEAGSRDLSSIIYTVANSKEKTRMSKDLKIRPSATWAVSVVSSGEVDILEYCQKTSGLEDRVLRFQNLPITKSADHADKIQLELSLNYGFAAPMFARYLIEQGIDQVEATIQTIKAEITEKTEQDEISPRHKEKLSIVLAAAKLCAECFSFEIDYPALEQLLLYNERSGKEDRNTGQQAFDMVCDFVDGNYKKFNRDKQNCSGSQCCGKIIFVKAPLETESQDDPAEQNKPHNFEYHTRVYFIRTVIDDLLKKRGYLNPTQIYTEWKQLGLLYTNETSHLGVKEKSLGKLRTIAITIPYLVGSITDDEEEVEFPGPTDGVIDF